MLHGHTKKQKAAIRVKRAGKKVVGKAVKSKRRVKGG